VRELQERMDAVEFAEWQAYYRIQPFGDDWAQASTVAWMLYQVNRTSKSDNLSMDTFLPKSFGIGLTPDRTRVATPVDVTAKLMQWAKLNGVKHVG